MNCKFPEIFVVNRSIKAILSGGEGGGVNTVAENKVVARMGMEFT